MRRSGFTRCRSRFVRRRAGIGHNDGEPGYLAPEVPLTITAP